MHAALGYHREVLLTGKKTERKTERRTGTGMQQQPRPAPSASGTAAQSRKPVTPARTERALSGAASAVPAQLSVLLSASAREAAAPAGTGSGTGTGGRQSDSLGLLRQSPCILVDLKDAALAQVSGALLLLSNACHILCCSKQSAVMAPTSTWGYCVQGQGD